MLEEKRINLFSKLNETYKLFEEDINSQLIPLYNKYRPSIDKKAGAYVREMAGNLVEKLTDEQMSQLFGFKDLRFTYRRHMSEEEILGFGLTVYRGPFIEIDSEHISIAPMRGDKFFDDGKTLDLLNELSENKSGSEYIHLFSEDIINFTKDIGISALVFNDNLFNRMLVGNQSGDYSVLAIQEYDSKNNKTILKKE